MAKEKFFSKLPAHLRAEKKTLKSSFLVLAIFSFRYVVAALIVAAEIGICQHTLQQAPSRGRALPDEILCRDQDVVVHSREHEDALIACEGARDAISFLESRGLYAAGTIVIELLSELPAEVYGPAAGCYLESEKRALILVYSEFKKFETWFGVSIDRSLYRSAVSHEVAHAVADFNFTISKPSIKANEYIAYITQFSTMEKGLRDRVLAHFPGKAFEGDWQMSTTIYMLDPMGFGPRAYLHFLKLIDGDEYLHAILNGKELFLDFW
jgi:hypothetical protein